MDARTSDGDIFGQCGMVATVPAEKSVLVAAMGLAADDGYASPR
jgi:hypothetical protein